MLTSRSARPSRTWPPAPQTQNTERTNFTSAAYPYQCFTERPRTRSNTPNPTHFQPRSIFQSKDDPEIGFRFQYKVILKSEGSAAQRPVSFLGFWFEIQASRSSRREPRVGKWETWFRFSTFPSGAMPGCGNVGISRLWRDSQGAVESGEKLLLLFPALHGPGISIALPVRPSRPPSRRLPCVRRFALAAPQQGHSGGPHLPRPFGVAHRLRHCVQARKAHAFL